MIVDEAHTCASVSQRRHQRHELLQGLAGAASRHLVLLTATPHSGDDAAFYRLLGLLDPDFEGLAEATGPERDASPRAPGEPLRPETASGHRRVARGRHLSAGAKRGRLTYQLTGAWEAFFDDVLDYCAEVVETDAGDEVQQRLNFWGTLALLRCTGSSPVAAVLALRTRAGEDLGERDPRGSARSHFRRRCRLPRGGRCRAPGRRRQPGAGAADEGRPRDSRA